MPDDIRPATSSTRALDPGRPPRGGRAARRALAVVTGPPGASAASPAACCTAHRCRSRSPRAGSAAGPHTRVTRVTAAFGAPRRRPRGRGRGRGRAGRGVAAGRLVRRRAAAPVTRGSAAGRRRHGRDWARRSSRCARHARRIARLPAVAARARGGGRPRARLGGGAGGRRVGGGRVLVVGSSSAGPLARVFLGSRATKIVRHSPVPVGRRPPRRRRRVAEQAGQPERRRIAIPVSASRMTRSSCSRRFD